MRRSRFTEGQILGILKEHEAGRPKADLCRKHEISDQTLYNWKAEYGGLKPSEASRLKGLEGAAAELPNGPPPEEAAG
jgi:putative transposase